MLPVTRALQAKRMDVVTALEGVSTCTKVLHLQAWREQPNERFAEDMAKVQKVADTLDVTIKPPRCAAKSIYRANAGDCEDTTGLATSE